MQSDPFPKSAQYDLSWLTDGYGANPLWLTEWLCGDIDLQPGMRVLDLGCGKARSSVFLAKEYGVNVVAVDLWNTATDNDLVIREAGVENLVTAMQLDARDLPFPDDHFDAIISIDSFQYYGTDCLYLPYVLRFVKPAGTIAFASAGLTNDLGTTVPEHLTKFWQPDAWCIRTSQWWRHHWERTGLVTIGVADSMSDGWEHWLRWAELTDCVPWYLDTLRTDHGRFLGYVRQIATRVPDRQLLPYDLRTGKLQGG